MSAPRVGVLVAVMGMFAGCGDVDSLPDGVVESDSLGIRIIESRTPLSEPLPWTFSRDPIVQIGSADGSSGDILFRVTGVRVLDDGRLIVSNSGSQEVRIYDPSGSLLASFGREGPGPGEFARFSGMQLLHLTSDSVVVNDGAQRRLQVWGLDGTFGRAVSVQPVHGFGNVSLVGRLDSGHWLGVGPVGSGALGGEPGDLIEMPLALLSYTADLTSASEIVRLTGRPRVVNELGGGAIHFPFVPLTPEPVYAVSGDKVLVGVPGSPEVHRVSRNGEVEAVVRWNAPRTPVDEVWARFATHFVENAPEDRRMALARLVRMRELPVPEFLPIMQRMLVDAVGNVWIELYRLPWQLDRRWHVLDPRGRWLGELPTPEGLDVMSIGEDYILGRSFDELGVERVVSYRLDRGALR
jgi:hypothetical protein